MWNRQLIKEEAKKAFTYKDNYWRFVLAALLIALLTGGLAGGFSGGGVGRAISALSITNGSDNHDNSKSYRHYSTIEEGTDSQSHSAKITEKDGKIVIEQDGKTIEVPENIGDYIRNGNIGDIPGISEYIQNSDPSINDNQGKSDNGDRGHFRDEDAADVQEFGQAFAIVGMVIAIVLPVVLIVSLISLAVTLSIKAFLINPVILGAKSLFLKAYDRPAKTKDLLNGFKNNYLKNVGTLILRDIFTGLWTLLFIVPGIIKAYEYRMIPYLIAENPNMSYKEAFAKSKNMMMGNKWDTFVLDLSFLGWFILNSLTCGILGLFYVNPYYYATDANLYRALKMGGSTGYTSPTINMVNVNQAAANATTVENVQAQEEVKEPQAFEEAVEDAKNVADEVLGKNTEDEALGNDTGDEVPGKATETAEDNDSTSDSDGGSNSSDTKE